MRGAHLRRRRRRLGLLGRRLGRVGYRGGNRYCSALDHVGGGGGGGGRFELCFGFVFRCRGASGLAGWAPPLGQDLSQESMGPLTLTRWFSWVSFHDVPDALLADDLGYDIVAQQSDGVGGVRQAAAAQVHLRVRLHLYKRENLLVARLVDEAGAQQVVDAQRLAGRRALGVLPLPGNCARSS